MNPQLIQAILQLLAQDPSIMTQSQMMQPAQYYPPNPNQRYRGPGTDVPMPPRPRNESSYPKGNQFESSPGDKFYQDYGDRLDREQQRQRQQSPGDQFYEDMDRRNRRY